MSRLTPREVRDLQHNLNYFDAKFLGKDMPMLMVDGEIGPATRHRIRVTRWLLGYKRENLDEWPTLEFRRQLRHPKTKHWSDPGRIARGIKRRIQFRAETAHNKLKARRASGVTTYDGRPVARWMVPYLDFARHTGDRWGRWHGVLVSGFRDPVYSEHLCYRICGRPTCPGRCAGRYSNHSGDVVPHGAVDVSEYITFGRIMRSCPYSPRIFNALASTDPVHFSATGR